MLIHLQWSHLTTVSYAEYTYSEGIKQQYIMLNTFTVEELNTSM